MKPALELTWFQIGCAVLAWAIIGFVLLIALAGCKDSTRFTPLIQPTCVVFCFAIVTETDNDHEPKEHPP